jgi:cupin superfamily acireductone dioxygenase involved in methionine salvage
LIGDVLESHKYSPVQKTIFSLKIWGDLRKGPVTEEMIEAFLHAHLEQAEQIEATHAGEGIWNVKIVTFKGEEFQDRVLIRG